MTDAPDDISTPALLRHAHACYGAAMRAALKAAGFADIPKNGLYVLGGLALQKGGRPLSRLIEELRISKQAAGQLVDTLVVRGYLRRDVDEEDRRRLTVALTERGRAAAKAMAAARTAVDTELTARMGRREVERARRVLAALVDIGHALSAPADDAAMRPFLSTSIGSMR